MAREWRRIVAFSLLAALLAASVSGCASARGAPWIGGFDRSANAVMARFNQLAASWSELRGSDDAPGIPAIARAQKTGDFAFSFQPQQGSEFENECSRYTISGETSPQTDKVERLTISIDRTLDKVTPEYLTNCDRLMQLALFSLFDSLDDRLSSDLSLLFVYDIRPFNVRSVDVSLPDGEKGARCVVDGQLIGFSSSVSDGSHISMSAEFLGAATGAQIGENRENVSCNRKLSQANIECTELSESMVSLAALLDEDDPDWEQARAVADLLAETTDVIRELCTLLLQHEKTISYVSRIATPCAEFETLNGELIDRIGARDLDSAEDLILSMELIATQMQMLISMMLT